MNNIVRALSAFGFVAACNAAPATPPAPQFGSVISSTPVTVQVTVPRQQCTDEPGYVQSPASGGGAVVGGIIGGLAGNAIGAGAGRALATGAGVIAGAIVGNGVEAANTAAVPVTTTNCVYARSVESKVVGYDVVYDFNGQRYTTRTVRDPGARIALDVRPAGEAAYDPTPIANMAEGPAYPTYPSYPAYPAYPAPYIDSPYPYPPFGYGGAYYGYPGVPVVIGGRIGGGRRWR